MAVQASPQAKRSAAPFTIIGVVLALVGFGLVFFLGGLGGGSKSGGGSTATQPVVVAARDISSRSSLVKEDVMIAQFAAADVPAGSYTKVDDVKGMVARVDIKKGQALAANFIAKSGEDIITSQAAYLGIPSGFVALTIPTNEQQGVGGYIQAGDYIAVVASAKNSASTYQNSRTVFHNVHVLKVGPAPEPVSPAGGGAPGTGGSSGGTTARTGGIASSLTIVVTQCQAEFINWFLKNQSVIYTLESYKDYQPQDKVDASCPSVTAAKGVTEQDVRKQWPGLLG